MALPQNQMMQLISSIMGNRGGASNSQLVPQNPLFNQPSGLGGNQLNSGVLSLKRPVATQPEFSSQLNRDSLSALFGGSLAGSTPSAGRETKRPNLSGTLNEFKGFPTRHPMVQNEDGSRSNVILSGVTLDDGRVVAFPTMIDGVKHTHEEALKIAFEHGIDNYPAFDSPEALNAWAEANHANINEDGTLAQ